jgi:hypothetical protein
MPKWDLRARSLKVGELVLDRVYNAHDLFPFNPPPPFSPPSPPTPHLLIVKVYYAKFPVDMAERYVVLMDPLLGMLTDMCLELT